MIDYLKPFGEFMRRNKLRAILVLISISGLFGCANVNPHKNIYYDPNQGFTEGEPINYTAMVERTLTLDGKELSRRDDPNIRAHFTDFGNNVSYVGSSDKMNLVEVPLPANLHKDWDRCFYSETCVALESVIKDGHKEISRTLRPDISARIIDSGNSIRYIEGSITLDFSESKLPSGSHEDWERCFYTRDNRYGLLKSSKKKIYRLFFKDKQGYTRQIDFSNQFGMVKSTKKAIYRIWYVDDRQTVHSFDYLPTRNFICADLTKAYANVRMQMGMEVAKTLILGLIQSYTSYTETTYYGSSTSRYNGVYNDSFGRGTWSGYGSSSFSAYSRTYDYSYVGERSADLLNTIFSGSATIDQITTAMKENGCACP